MHIKRETWMHLHGSADINVYCRARLIIWHLHTLRQMQTLIVVKLVTSFQPTFSVNPHLTTLFPSVVFVYALFMHLFFFYINTSFSLQTYIVLNSREIVTAHRRG